VTPLDPRVYRTSIHKLAMSVSLLLREQVLAISFDLVGSEIISERIRWEFVC
jgi:hypothetical protein